MIGKRVLRVTGDELTFVDKDAGRDAERILREAGDDATACLIRDLRDERDTARTEAAAAALRGFMKRLIPDADYSYMRLCGMLEQEAQAYLRNER
jgi:hypothetical protein